MRVALAGDHHGVRLGPLGDALAARPALLYLQSSVQSPTGTVLAAARRLSPEEAVIIADLERHGLQVPQLRDVLCGGHVIVDDPELYQNWSFPRVSHQRLSSHHRDIDKTRYPDIGMRGLVVREKLHGRTAQGTWVQLEKTPAK